MNSTILSRKEKDRVRRKEEILEAALRLFSNKGFHNISMQDIAAESEFGVGTLYNFFESKDVLFEALLKRTGDYVIREYSEILDKPGSEKERLAAFIRYQPKFLKKHSDILKLYVSEVGINASKLSKIKYGDRIHEAADSKIAQIIEQGIRKGLFRPVDPPITAKTLGSIIETLILESTTIDDGGIVTGMFNNLEQLFLDGLLKPKDQDDDPLD